MKMVNGRGCDGKVDPAVAGRPGPQAEAINHGGTEARSGNGKACRKYAAILRRSGIFSNAVFMARSFSFQPGKSGGVRSSRVVFFGGEWNVASERGSIQPRAVLLKAR